MISSHGEVSGRKSITRRLTEGTANQRIRTTLHRGVNADVGQDRDQDLTEGLICDPCRSEQNIVEADRYCNTCGEYLCKTCVRFHKKFSATASHSLQTIADTSDAVDFGAVNPPENRHQRVKEKRLYDMVPIYYDEINVRTSFDRHNCNITGCGLLSSGNLVLCDNENGALKILDLSSRHIISYDFESNPWDITISKDQEIAVSLPHEKKIELFTLFSTDSTRARKRSLKVSGKCMGLESFGDHLVISYPFKIEIISIRGRVEVKGVIDIKSSTVPDQFDPGPWYLAASYVNKFLFVSCRNSSEVLKLNISRERSCRRVKDEDIIYPAGLCVVNDSELLICNWDLNEIELIGIVSGSGKKILLDEHDRLKHPQAVCYCSKQRKMFVSSYWLGGDPKCLNNIKVFQFSPNMYIKSSTEC